MTRKQPRRVRSTDSEPLASTPVEATANPGRPDSTDAVDHAHAEPIETRATHLDESVTVRVEPPSEPFSASVGWLSDAHSKVVEPPPAERTPRSSRTKPETKSTGDDADRARDA